MKSEVRGARAGASPRRRLGARVAALALGAVLSLLAVEGALAVVGLFLAEPELGEGGRAGADALTLPEQGENVVLCLGDSNTYGIHLEAEQSYPAQLGELLAGAPDGPWRVFNLGFPGRNSAEVRYHLAEQLELYRPRIVVVWVGTNTSWSRAMAHLWALEDREAPPPPLSILESLRTVRMVRVLLDRPARVESTGPVLLGDGAEGRLDFVERGAPRAAWLGAPEDDELFRRVELDLVRVAELCSAAGAKLLLLDYPYDVAHLRDVVNPAIAAAAERGGAAVLSLERELAPRIQTLGPERLLFADHHLKAEANVEVARLVARRFAAEGWLPFGDWLRVPRLEERVPHLEVELRGAKPDRPRTVALVCAGTPRALVVAELLPLILRHDREFADPVREVRREWLEQYLGVPLVRDVGWLDLSGKGLFTLELPPALPIGPPTFAPRTRFFGWRLELRLQLADGSSTRVRGRTLDPFGRVLPEATRAALVELHTSAKSGGAPPAGVPPR